MEQMFSEHKKSMKREKYDRKKNHKAYMCEFMSLLT